MPGSSLNRAKFFSVLKELSVKSTLSDSVFKGKLSPSLRGVGPAVLATYVHVLPLCAYILYIYCIYVCCILANEVQGMYSVV